LSTNITGPLESVVAEESSTSIRVASNDPSGRIAPSTFRNIPGESAEASLTPWNTVALSELAARVLVPKGPPAMVRVSLEGDVPTDAIVATSPLTLPFSEFVGEPDKISGVRLKVGVMENP
jgi:hypothetical protein